MLILISLYTALIIFTGIITIRFNNNPFAGKYTAPAVYALSSLVLFIIIIKAYISFTDEVITLSWSLPFAQFKIGADYITLFFMIPLMLLSALCSLYGAQYFKDRGAGLLHWFSYSLLVAGMVMVLISRNAVLFLISWEVMSFSSFLLVITDYEKKSVRRAGWIYFITAHVGTAFLFTAFFLLSSETGSFDFEIFDKLSFSVTRSNLIFITALIGFGLKAGFIPFHIWLPLAHPAAPSHVSALMSGIMIKMGIYGIIRVLLFLNLFQFWWGILLIALGAVTGILGVLFAIAQKDIKKMLAYSSVENIGIILLGLGMGITGKVYGNYAVSVFGFAGAFMHIFNHAVFKALLFLGAGSVMRQTGTGEIDSLGGLVKKLPWTGYLFLAGSAAIAGLPFFNGFISELFIFISSITGAVKSEGALMPMVSAVTVMSLAAVGGFSSLCFTKLFGAVFQGLPRKNDISKLQDVPSMMKFSMIILALFTVFIGMTSFVVLPFIEKPALILSGVISEHGSYFTQIENILIKVSSLLFSLLFLFFFLLLLKSKKYKKTVIKVKETWGCGYSFPSNSMQYTASSYSAPAVDKFRNLLAERKKHNFTGDFFPQNKWSFLSEVEDWFLSRIFIKTAKIIDRILALLRWFQCGKAGVYVLYVAFTVVILIIWKFVL